MIAAEQQNQSEVAQLRQRIEDECVALNHLMNGMSVVSKHDFIAQRMATISACAHEMGPYIEGGEDEALRIASGIYMSTVERPTPVY